MQNPFELVFQDVSTFDAQNPVAGSMAGELDIGKKDIESNLVKKASKTGLTNDIQKRLDALRGDNFFNNNNNNFSPPTFNNFVPPPQAPPPPFNSFNLLPTPPLPTFNLPSPPSPPTCFFTITEKGSAIQQQHPLEAILTRTKPEPEKVIENIDMDIYEIPDPPKI